MGEYDSSRTVCPFYRKEESNTIKCEGITEGSYISQYFCRVKDKQIQKDVFCNGRYWYCEICRMLMESKYADE